MSVFVILNTCKSFSKHKLFYLVCIFIFSIPMITAMGDKRFQYKYPQYDCLIETGKLLKEKHPHSTLAISAAGKVPFYSELPTIDMLGLNDRHIGKSKVITKKHRPGHSKFDPKYVLSKKPDLIAAPFVNWPPPSRDLKYGMLRSLYYPDYELKYIVNTSRLDLGDKNIIDVGHENLSTIERLITDKHRYGILLRRDHKSTH